jgi:hypothetical protein
MLTTRLVQLCTQPRQSQTALSVQPSTAATARVNNAKTSTRNPTFTPYIAPGGAVATADAAAPAALRLLEQQQQHRLLGYPNPPLDCSCTKLRPSSNLP